MRIRVPWAEVRRKPAWPSHWSWAVGAGVTVSGSGVIVIVTGGGVIVTVTGGDIIVLVTGGGVIVVVGLHAPRTSASPIITKTLAIPGFFDPGLFPTATPYYLLRLVCVGLEFSPLLRYCQYL